jgi:hypothetical protein
LVLGFDPNIAWFIDLPSVLIIIIFPLIFMGILHGWKNIGSVFTIFCNKNIGKKDLLSAKTFFESYCKIIFSIAFISFILSFIAMMKNLEVKEELGPNMALASFILLYAGIINMVIIIPYKIIIKRKIMEMEE